MNLRVRFIRLLLAVVLSLGALLTVGVAPAQAAGPCRVEGYTLHARLRMAERDISKSEVRASVSRFCSSGYRQSDGTWIYRASGTSGLPTVVLNSRGYVVTAFWPSGGGGGGGGSW